MMKKEFELVLQPSGKTLPAGKIFCIGRNYASHAKELGNEVPSQPVLFMKGSTALWPADRPVPFPAHGSDLQHEAELVVLIGREGKNIPEAEALSYVAGYGIGLDLTLRDLQSQLKKAGLPWEVSKSFDASAPLGLFSDRVTDPANLEITCEVNGELRQHGFSRNLIFPIPFLISWISRAFTLEPGDLIFTGTPEGVGSLKPGDHVRVAISGIGSSDFYLSGD